MVSKNCKPIQDTYKSSISTTSMMVLTRKTKTIKYDRLVLTYLCSILLTNSYAPDQWYHINCQGIDEKMYKILDKSNLSWNCINCGMPNFSTTFLNSTIPELSNTYPELELEISNDSENESTDNIGLPTYTSSPIQKNQTQSSSTTKKRQGKNKKDTHTSKNSEPLRLLTINFQTIKNKKPEVELIIESCKPSIIFGNETWLSNNISPYEYIPSSKYNIYTKNRKDGHGGVLLAISNQVTSHYPAIGT